MTNFSTDEPKVALAGNPNCGKTALFNAITGGRAKVGNYAGVTVERKEGMVVTPNGLILSLLDLPGTYSLDAKTPDEMVTRDVLLGKRGLSETPDVLVAVADATNLERSLGLVIELRELGKPIILALNMMDLAQQRGLELDLQTLGRELKVPIVPTVATRKEGIESLLLEAEKQFQLRRDGSLEWIEWKKSSTENIRKRFREIDRILALSTLKSLKPTRWTEKIDQVVLHPFWGSLLLLMVLSLIFQAIFTWAQVPMEFMKQAIEVFAQKVGNILGNGPLQSLLVDGVIAGVGSVFIFLPQILLLFFFILFLEDSGYLPRAAFLMDKLMGKVGLHGRAFIPLLSSFACAIPGIMATRTIENKRDRLTTILVAPLMTCSARIPVYSLLIAAFIPNRAIWGPFRLQGLVMLSLYICGVGIALLMAVIFRKTLLRGRNPALLLELPTYKWPSLLSIGVGLLERARLFARRAGSVILTVSITLWFLASYPKAPVGATEPAIFYSFAGRIGHAMEPYLRPIGFNWKIAVALIPGFTAREVMVGSLATVYAVEGKEQEQGSLLGQKLAQDWSLATALSLITWYILACQCLSTLAVTRRETNSWRWPLFMLSYMTCLAYLGCFVVYQSAVRLGWG